MIIVNGKALSTILDELREPIKIEREYKIADYESRLLSVVGSNYSLSYQNFQMLPLANRQLVCSVLCVLQLHDEHGQVVFSTSGVGTWEISMVTASGNYSILNNAGYLTQLNAFKSVCKSLQIFGVHNTEDASSNVIATKKESISKSPASAKSSKVPKEFIPDGDFSQVRKDAKSDKPVYRLSAHEVYENKMQQETCDIIFYPNQYAKNTSKMNVLLGMNKSQGKCRIHCIVQEVSQNAANKAAAGKTYVFMGFC